MSLIDQMLQKYALATHEDTAQALREVMQEIALAGLQRGGFYDWRSNFCADSFKFPNETSY